jgi:hypothetical protein
MHRLSRTLLLAAPSGVACLSTCLLSVLWSTALAGCEEREERRRATAPKAAVSPPLENPAGYCRDSCPLLMRCRLGRVSPKLFDQEVQRCRERCLAWIEDHPDEAAALHPCYDHEKCSRQRACLAEVRRIVKDRKIPAKRKECQQMCVTLGTCQGDATDCRLRCETGSVPIYRALIRCGTKRCPDLRGCVEMVLSDARGARK